MCKSGLLTTFGGVKPWNSSSCSLMYLIFKFSIQTQLGQMYVHWARVHGQDCCFRSDAIGVQLSVLATVEFSRQVLGFGCTFYIHLPGEQSITPTTEAASHSGLNMFTVYRPTMALRLCTSWTNMQSKNAGIVKPSGVWNVKGIQQNTSTLILKTPRPHTVNGKMVEMRQISLRASSNTEHPVTSLGFF